jgi:hypothetical protein
MLPVYQAPSLPEAELFRQRLQQLGIEAVIRNDHLQGALGELPANLLPEVCVIRDKDFEAARAQVAEIEHVASEPPGPERLCSACGETSPANFELCWKCRADL